MNKYAFLKLLLIFATTTAYISSNAQRTTNTNLDVSGNWQVTISVAGGTIIGKGSLSQNGNLVTGWVGPDENDPITITGIFKKSKLILQTLPSPGRTVAFDKVKLKIAGDSMFGVIKNGSHGKGTIKFLRSK